MDDDHHRADTPDVKPRAQRRLRRARAFVVIALALTALAVVAVVSYGSGSEASSTHIEDLQRKLDDQTSRLRRQGKSIESLAASVDGLTQQLRTRASNAQHVICTDELLRQLLPPAVGFLTTDRDDPRHRDLLAALLVASANLQAGLDPSTGACPPLPAPGN